MVILRRLLLLIRNSLLFQIILGIFLFLIFQKLCVYYSFHTSFNDFYHKANATWNIYQDNGMLINLWGKSYLSNHFYPFHYLIAIFYFIFPTPVWMMLFQVVCQTIMAAAILKLAEEQLGRKGLIVTTALLFANYSFRRFNIEPLFGESVMAPLVAWIIYFLIHRKDRFVLILTLLLFFTKESVASIVVMIGAYYFLFRKKYIYGAFLALIAIFHALFLIYYFIPSFNPAGYDFSSYFAYSGGDLSTKFFRIFNGRDIGYLIGLLLPLGFLPLFCEYFILGLGVMAQNILSVHQKLMIDLGYHTSQPLIPILFMSAILVYSKFSKSIKPPFIFKYFRSFIIISIALNLLLFTFLDLRVFYFDSFAADTHRFLSQIPPTASASGSKYIGAHLSQRSQFYRFPRHQDADYIIVENRDQLLSHHQPHAQVGQLLSDGYYLSTLKALVFDASPHNASYYLAIEKLRNNPNYEIIGEGRGVLLFKRTGALK